MYNFDENIFQQNIFLLKTIHDTKSDKQHKTEATPIDIE